MTPLEYWIHLGGKELHLVGPGKNAYPNGRIIGHGQYVWDLFPSAPNVVTRFPFIVWSSTGGKIDGITVENSPFWNLNLVGAKDVVVNNVNITAKSNNKVGLL